MAFGKSIRIYLKDGNVSGLKFGEVVNYTIQAIACPRIKTNELSESSEARRPGVYFLFEKIEETNEDWVYMPPSKVFTLCPGLFSADAFHAREAFYLLGERWGVAE